MVEKPARRVHEHIEKRAKLPKLKTKIFTEGFKMERSDLIIYSVNVEGIHPVYPQKRYYGVALNLDDALNLAFEKALDDGFQRPLDVESFDKMGEVSFAPWNSKDYPNHNECIDQTDPEQIERDL